MPESLPRLRGVVGSWQCVNQSQPIDRKIAFGSNERALVGYCCITVGMTLWNGGVAHGLLLTTQLKENKRNKKPQASTWLRIFTWPTDDSSFAPRESP